MLAEESPGDAIRIPSSPAPRETLQDYVYGQIRELILNGEIQPGKSITMKSLATAFQVSHMPVREALQRLTAERALAVVAGRSIGIPPLSTERLEDLCRVRKEVEGLAAAWAATRAVPETLVRMPALHDALETAIGRGDVKAYLRTNRELHFTVYDAAGSATLDALIESLWLQISPYFGMLGMRGTYEEANRYHGELIVALRNKDADAARRAVVSDIEATAAALRLLI